MCGDFQLLVIFRWRSPLIGGADFQQPYRINDVRQRNREENDVLLERRYPLEQVPRYTGACSKCTNSFQRSEERRKRCPWQTLMPRELFQPVTRSLSRYSLDSDT